MSTHAIEMSSDIYGSEVFKYDSAIECLEGLQRLINKVTSLCDGVDRVLTHGELDEDGDILIPRFAAEFDGERWEIAPEVASTLATLNN